MFSFVQKNDFPDVSKIASSLNEMGLTESNFVIAVALTYQKYMELSGECKEAIQNEGESIDRAECKYLVGQSFGPDSFRGDVQGKLQSLGVGEQDQVKIRSILTEMLSQNLQELQSSLGK